MPATTKHYAPEIIIRARREYAEGGAVGEIVARAGTNAGTLYKWLAGDVPGLILPPIPRRRPGVRRLRPTKATRLAVVRRLWHVAEQQAREIDQRLAAHGQAPSGRAPDARDLSLLVKTLKDLIAMDEADARAAGHMEPDKNDDDVRDIEEFRRDLARKMDAVIARRAAGGSGGAESG
jgi:hypothetical protein